MKKLWRYCVILAGIVLLLSGCAKAGGQPEKDRAAVLADTAENLSETDSVLRMTFLDTGKSDCIIIETKGHVVVNDAADADDADMICKYLDNRRIEQIDYLILSHFDKDHIGSAAWLLSQYKVGCVLMPDQEKESESYLALMDVLAQTDTETRRLVEDYEFILEDVAFAVDAPDEDAYEDDNNYSLITAVSCGEVRFLLMGDALKKRTGEFLESDAGEARYDLIKMPHHGDYNKKLSELFETAMPDYVILTAGKERERVEDKTIELLIKSGCRVFYTDEGTITVLSDGRIVTLMQ